jgi:hypothetical protein
MEEIVQYAWNRSDVIQLRQGEAARGSKVNANTFKGTLP